MYVWLHTSSPPQHIANVSEADFTGRGGATAYLAAINERRHIRAEFCGVFEDAHGETSVQIFATQARADAWMTRNALSMDLIIGAKADPSGQVVTV